MANGYVSDTSKVVTALSDFKKQLIDAGFRAEILPTKTFDDTLANDHEPFLFEPYVRFAELPMLIVAR